MGWERGWTPDDRMNIFDPRGPIAAAEKTILQVHMDYQRVDDIQLPKSIAISGSTGGTPFAMDVAFTDCTATKR